MTYSAATLATFEKYPVTVGNVAYVKTTDEPVFVMGIQDNLAVVRRPTNTEANGVVHVTESFSLSELHTAQAKFAAEAEFYKFQQATKESLVPSSAISSVQGNLFN